MRDLNFLHLAKNWKIILVRSNIMCYVLITGCNGFVGEILTISLLKKGHKVLGISKSKYPKVSHKNFKYICADITDCKTIEGIFSKYIISSVIHLAAIAHIRNRKKIDWNEFYRVNTLASKTIFQCAVNNGAKIFFASTVDVYGSTQCPVITEDVKPNPISDYAKSKYLAEKILIEIGEKNSHPYLIGRFAPVYAKNYMKDVYKRVYLKYPLITFFLGNEYYYHFVSVYNVVDFIINWLESSKEITGIYNVCDDQPINIKRFIQLEKNIGNSKKTIYLPKPIFTFIKYFSSTIYLIFRIEKFKKVYTNLYKLTNPSVYSIIKMKNIIQPKWDLENTVYDNDIFPL